MALLAVARELANGNEIELKAAHLVHHFHATEPKRRASLVKTFCRTKQIPLTVANLSVPTHSKASPEEWMRTERYRFLERLAEEQNCDVILTAHHADDQAETVLHRVLSGTGLKGLRGIQVQRGKLLRPFLQVRKSALLEYCRVHQVPYLEDPTNRDVSIPRNFIRHEILPRVATHLNPDAVGALNRVSRWAMEADEILQKSVQECWEAALQNFQKDKIILDLQVILTYFTMIQKYTIQKALSEIAGEPLVLSAGELDRIARFLKHSRTGSSLLFAGNLEINRDRRNLIIRSVSAQELHCILTPGESIVIPELSAAAKWERLQSGDYSAGDGWIADLDLGRNSGRLLLRYAREGDRFYPLGAPGAKRLYRFLTDRKVPRFEKRTTPVLVRDGEIIWVIGHRIAESVRIKAPGDGVWRLQLTPLREGDAG